MNNPPFDKEDRMTSVILRAACALLVLGALLSPMAYAASNASIEGVVRDSQTGEPLPGANIVIVRTSLGASTDVEGRFIIRNVPTGAYTIRAAYVGYQQKTVTVQVKDGETLRQDFKLAAVGVEGQEVVITAQAAGQKEAINKQLSSMPVMNVVSAARIQELPDANAAESVGRLPGVSLIRTGGEGAQVVIRGLSPQYNQITIEGVELSSNVNSVNNIISADANQNENTLGTLGDRGMDLSMISSSMLGGIEVIKAITPDMDAAVLGGVVNFDMRKAMKHPGGDPAGPWLPHGDLSIQGGYNDLRQTRNDYKVAGSVEKRFVDESLGLFLQGTAERRNLGSNSLSASYNLADKDHGDAGIPNLERVDMEDYLRRRERVGGTFVIDYQHSTGSMGLLNSVSRSRTHTVRNGEELPWRTNTLYFSAEETNNELVSVTNILSLKQDFGWFDAKLKGSHTYSESRNPQDLLFSFWQMSRSGFENKGDLSKLDPHALVDIATPTPSAAILARYRASSAFSHERIWNGALDLETETGITDLVSAKVKLGGSVLYRTRDFDVNSIDGGNFWLGGPAITYILAKFPQLDPSNTGRLNMVPFLDGNYKPERFLKGEYSLPYSMKMDQMWAFLPYFQAEMNPEIYSANRLESVYNDYGGNETKSAAYLMGTFQIGENIKILPGVRYQNLSTTYHAIRGVVVPGGIQGGDTSVTQSHGYYLPMLHVRYEPLEWFTIHAAYTNTLNYPDYSTITPRYYVGDATIQYNNYRLEPARSRNLDLVLSFHSNEIGLFTINGFLKRIEGLIFFQRTYTSDLSAYPDLPQNKSQLFELDTYINNPIPIDVQGIETEWQTSMWYLPEPFSGLVFLVNYTHIFSESSYPRSTMNVTYDEDGNMVRTVTDTSYTTRLLNQPNDIVNLSLGYDYKGFSARVSMLYQDNIFKRPDFWMQNRINSASVTRWDLSVKQELPWEGLQVYLLLSNITGIMETDVNQRTLLPANLQYYGMTGDLGVRIRL
jgi:TonB-dependent receptor